MSNNNYNFTIFLTYYANGNIRRKYLEIALNTLFNNSKKDVPIIVVDASSKKDSLHNKSLFQGFTNLNYIHDEDINPFTRCNKYLSLIETDYVLRLLEDCAYINLFSNNYLYINKDIDLLENEPSITAIQYLLVDERKLTAEENIIYYSPVDANDFKENIYNSYKYYNRSKETKNYHYLCNNLLYRRDFFQIHWNYMAQNYTTHNNAEAGNREGDIYSILSKNKYLWKILRRLIKWKEKVFNRNEILTNIVVTETSIKSDSIHIGYYSTEKSTEGSIDREKSKVEKDGTMSIISSLKVFNNMQLLDNVQFKRY